MDWNQDHDIACGADQRGTASFEVDIGGWSGQVFKHLEALQGQLGGDIGVSIDVLNFIAGG